MAETRLHDCPNCGRTNVIGYKVNTYNESATTISGAASGTMIGAVIGGPIGAGIGLALGKLIGNQIGKFKEDNMLEYKFQCPHCSYKFSKYFEKI